MLVIALSCPLVAQEGDRDAIFAEYDLDGDGVIDRIEFGMSAVAQTAREEGREHIIGERFDRLDTNRDNAVSWVEFDAGRTGNTPEMAEASETNLAGEYFSEWDTNEDGAISEDEFVAIVGSREEDALKPFLTGDRNGDKSIDPQEFAGFTGTKPDALAKVESMDEDAEKRFEEIDRNKDLQISLSEFGRSRMGERMKKRGGRDLLSTVFNRLDSDQDRHLSKAEFAAMRLPTRPALRQ